jgi:type IV pilus assembly protein PilO
VNGKLKQWVALAAVAALVILAGGWFLLVSPKRSDAASLRSQTSDKQRANQLLASQLATLKSQAKDLPAQQAKIAAVAAKIPDNGAMPTLIRSLNSAAADTGVELVSLAPGQPTAVAPAAAAVTTPTAGSTTARSTAAAASMVGTLQSVGVTLNVVGSYFQVAEYLDRLENLTRAFRVTGFTETPGLNPVKPGSSQPTTDSGKSLTATITGQVFLTAGGTASSLTNAK